MAGWMDGWMDGWMNLGGGGVLFSYDRTHRGDDDGVGRAPGWEAASGGRVGEAVRHQERAPRVGIGKALSVVL